MFTFKSFRCRFRSLRVLSRGCARHSLVWTGRFSCRFRTLRVLGCCCACRSLVRTCRSVLLWFRFIFFCCCCCRSLYISLFSFCFCFFVAHFFSFPFIHLLLRTHLPSIGKLQFRFEHPWFFLLFVLIVWFVFFCCCIVPWGCSSSNGY